MGSILIVDDNLDGCRPLAKLLKHQGHRGICVGSGEEALAYLRSHRPDLVLLDVMMPGMDGLEVLRNVRADPQTVSLVIVMYSAVADPAFKEHAIAKGADDYWVKSGVDIDQLLEKIDHRVNPPPTTGDAGNSAQGAGPGPGGAGPGGG